MNGAGTELTMRFGYALRYALWLHRDQRRKASDVPYFSHLMAVASTVLDFGGGEDAAIAAMLHDAVEDQGGRATLDAIRERCGERVAALVSTLSDHVDGATKAAWAVRKSDYLARLTLASRDAKLVAAADKLHNLRCTVADLRSAGPRAMDKFNAPARDVVAFHAACIATVRDALPKALVDELDWTLAELRMLLALPAPGPRATH
jgi:(p)ppGpp synthase/HD superfamily hydrolase